MQRSDFGVVVGSAEFVFLFADGSRKNVELRVGMPYKVEDGGWACASELAGFADRHPDMHGGDSMQALCLAVTLIRRRVEDFLEKGGKVLDVRDGSEWPLASILAMFGGVGER